MSVARFVADQRTMHQVPHVFCCRILGLSVSWFYKWLGREPTDRQVRRGELDAAVKTAFDASGGTYGSPRIHADLLEDGWAVSVNTVADSMRRQGLQGRKPKHRKGLTKQDATAAKFPDLLHRDFTAPAPNIKWCGDITEIPTDEGNLYLATVLDLFSRKLLACPTSTHPDAELAWTRSRSQPRYAAAAPRSRASYFTPIADRPTPQHVSRAYVSVSACASRWAGSDRASTMPPRRRSSPRWNTRCCPGTTSPPETRPARLSSPGARISTTPAVGTVPPGCKHPTTTKRPPQNSRPRHDTAETLSQLGIPMATMNQAISPGVQAAAARLKPIVVVDKAPMLMHAVVHTAAVAMMRQPRIWGDSPAQPRCNKRGKCHHGQGIGHERQA